MGLFSRRAAPSVITANTPKAPPAPHFVSDYRRHMQTLSSLHPEAEAMSLAVGGDDERVGPIERDVVIAAGLRPNSDLIDVGCGSGRLALRLTDYLTDGSYLGTDVVPELLDYARARVPTTWRFALVDDIAIPATDASADMVTFFSVLTHLRHEESYALLQEAFRVLRPGGCVVASFLEFAAGERHWEVFEVMLRSRGDLPHLNQFIEQSALRVWADHLGFEVSRVASPPEPFAPGQELLGQSVIVLRKPGA